MIPVPAVVVRNTNIAVVDELVLQGRKFPDAGAINW